MPSPFQARAAIGKDSRHSGATLTKQMCQVVAVAVGLSQIHAGVWRHHVLFTLHAPGAKREPSPILGIFIGEDAFDLLCSLRTGLAGRLMQIA